MLQPRAHVVHTEFVVCRNHVAELKRKSLDVRAPTGHRSTVLSEYGLVTSCPGEGGDERFVAATRDVELLIVRDVAQETNATVAQNTAFLIENQRRPMSFAFSLRKRVKS
jgi:hypothetical protein